MEFLPLKIQYDAAVQSEEMQYARDEQRQQQQ